MRTLKEVLPLMADEIERRGWIRGEYAEELVENPDFDEATAVWDDKKLNWSIPAYVSVPLEDCRVCAMGAMGAVVKGNPKLGGDYGDPELKELSAQLADHLYPEWRKSIDGGHGAVTTWNDEAAESAEQVVARLRQIAAEL